MSTLDELLSAIDPEVHHAKLERAKDNALNTFHIDKAPMNHDELDQFLAYLFCQIDSHLLGLHPHRPVHLRMDSSRGRRILESEFGVHGFDTAMKMIRCGADGGLRRVIDTVAHGLMKEKVETRIRVEVGAFWGALDANEKILAVEEYLEKYGHLLPRDLTENGAARIFGQFPKVLENHPVLLREIGDRTRHHRMVRR